ncbi:hypothetical protein WN944_024128 [Citrus x changshan-huyou]|uniref:Uncharacterized protein n=1 Tax=Citrus x changshan-huyou TaxID=2935761 RepID=A0AAP0LN35_9ROSI
MSLIYVIENLGGDATSDGITSTHVVAGKSLDCVTQLVKRKLRRRQIYESFYMLNDDGYVLKYRSELKDAVLRAKARSGGLLKRI